MLTRDQLKGLIVPLITPVAQGAFDAQSMVSLMNSLDDKIDAYAPCMSTGEGQLMTLDLWDQVIAVVIANTTKPVIAGIKRKTYDEVVDCARLAKEHGCAAVCVPAPPGLQSDKKIINYFGKLASAIELPVVIYSTTEAPVASRECLEALNHIEQIIGIKDSSGNLPLFQDFVRLRSQRKISLSILQGLETDLSGSQDCDGFLVSLIHLEPELCHRMLHYPTEALEAEIQNCIHKYNLHDQWYASIKSVLCANKIIRSAETIRS